MSDMTKAIISNQDTSLNFTRMRRTHSRDSESLGHGCQLLLTHTKLKEWLEKITVVLSTLATIKLKERKIYFIWIPDYKYLKVRKKKILVASDKKENFVSIV